MDIKTSRSGYGIAHRYFSVLRRRYKVENIKLWESVKDIYQGSRVIIMTQANSSVKSKVLKLLPKLKTEETDSLCVA